MAMSPRKIGEGLYQPLADINVTPLVDVMLVLLIIFMVTAPMLATGIKVNLPNAQNRATARKQGAGHRRGRPRTAPLSVGKDPVSRDELAATVKARLGGSERRRAAARRPRRGLRRRRVGDGRTRGEWRHPDRHRVGPAPDRLARSGSAGRANSGVAEPTRPSHDCGGAGRARLRAAGPPAGLASPAGHRDGGRASRRRALARLSRAEAGRAARRGDRRN